MKKQTEKNQSNLFYIIIATVVVLLLCIGSFFIQNNNVYEPTVIDLPEDIESKINGLVINEIVSKNGGAYLSSDNELCDYIELYNGSNNDINLYGYGLTDSDSEIKWAFPQVTIKAKGYLIINLVGENREGLNANFKLKKEGGEKVILVKGNNKVIDGVNTVALSANQCMGRDADGNWNIYNFITPGFENSLTGREAYLNSLDASVLTEKKIIINELLVKNDGNFRNEDGVYTGYIELKNVSNETINLKDYWLTNTNDTQFKYRLPDYDLQPDEIYVFYCGDNALKPEKYLGFNFNSKDGCVILSYRNNIADRIEYANLANGLAYILDSNGSYQIDSVTSCGFENTAEGISKAIDKFNILNEGLIISEVMNSNFKYLYHNGSYYDWVEVYNNSNNDINLADYSLSNNDDNLAKYQLPQITLKAHEYFVIMCSGNTALTVGNYYHAGFKISEIESIYLSKDGKIVSSMVVSNIPTGYSYGINEGKNGYYYISTPTPLAKNNAGTQSISYLPVICTKDGVYNDVNNVIVNIQGEGTIYYTTDGSTPTTKSKKYSGPITLTKTTVLSIMSVTKGKLNSDIVNASYIINENHTMDVISIIVTPQVMNYLNYRGNMNTYQAYCEFFEEDGGFATKCGIEEVGGSARYVAKKGYQLKFDKEYGTSDLVYQVFDNRNYNVFDKLVIRASSTEFNRTGLRDILASTLMADYGTVDTLAQRDCILYINGNYYGIYSLREKNSPDTIAKQHDVSSDDMNFCRIDGEVKAGSMSWYRELCNYANTHDLTIQEYYDYMCSKIDMENFCDYWIAMSWTSNNDLLNIRFYTSPYISDGKMRYIFYDFDWALQNTYMDYISRYIADPSGYMGIGVARRENTLFRNLVKNKDFQKLYLTRMGEYCQKVWNPSVSLQRLNELIKKYEPEIERDRARWNLTMESWYTNIDSLKEYLKKYPKNWLTYTKKFFNLTDSQMKGYFGDLW